MYLYKGFTRYNIAPNGINKMQVYDSTGKKVGSLGLNVLGRPTGQKLYSFGLVSDMHLNPSNDEGMMAISNFENALRYFKGRGCEFCCHAGDMTNIGFWMKNEGTGEMWYDDFQMSEYKRIREKWESLMPIYGVCGNHENYYKSITENLTELEEYTGHPLYYYQLKHDKDLFLFVGQPGNSSPSMNDEEFTWLSNLLSTNTDKRCHVFTHFYISNDSGNTKNCYPCNFSRESDFKELLKNHGKAIHYHGHSHVMLERQDIDKTTNITRMNGYPSIHVPSIGESRDVVLQEDGSYKKESIGRCAQCYLVDVYDDCIVYNGIALDFENVDPYDKFEGTDPEFKGVNPIALGTFKIDIAR